VETDDEREPGIRDIIREEASEPREEGFGDGRGVTKMTPKRVVSIGIVPV
jgi:hypothetical protein